MRRLWWIVPDRGTPRHKHDWERRYGEAYRAAAASCGLDFARHDPGLVVVDGTGGPRPEVFVDGVPVRPTDTIFVTALYSFPHHIMDTFKQLSVFTVLEQAGFYLPVPPRISFVANDKMAAALYLADCPVPPIPTFRFGTGRDDSLTGAVSLSELPYPVVVKPAGWAGGVGVCLAENERQVRMLASLASGSDCGLVCQPYLGAGTTDYRLFIVDGRVHTTKLRVPSPGAVTANVSRGGRSEFVDFPAQLGESVDYLAEKFPIPYFCADFLFDGRNFHLSEIEPDGAYLPDHTGRVTGLLEARFAAYGRGHARFLGQRTRAAVG